MFVLSELHSITLGPRLGFVVVGGGGTAGGGVFRRRKREKKKRKGKKGKLGDKLAAQPRG